MRYDSVMTFSEQLRMAIRESPKSLYQIGEESGVSRGVLSRFLAGERGITTDTLDRLAGVLNLQVVILKKEPKGKGR